jgi:hypothetical protein
MALFPRSDGTVFFTPIIFLAPYNWANMNRILHGLCCAFLAASFQSSAQAQSSNATPSTSAPATEKVPEMNGEAGPCSLDLTVTGADGKPAYAAKVKVHIAYGFAGTHRLDLEAGTNSDGKVKFTGLPARVHRPPLEFHASKDGFEGIATFDPTTECQAKHDITLAKPKAMEGY